MLISDGDMAVIISVTNFYYMLLDGIHATDQSQLA